MLSVELDALGYRMEQHIVALGGVLDKMVLYPQPEGLVVAATINGRSAAVRIYPGSKVSYLDAVDVLMRECQTGVEHPFPQDADVLALHEGVKENHG